MTTIDTADTVLHKPTGEKWLVACVQGDRLSWCGWPGGTAELSDCELVKKATPEQRSELLRDMASLQDGDHRGRYARERLEAEKLTQPATASWPYGSMGEYVEMTEANANIEPRS